MSVNQTYDFMLNGNGYMLARDPQHRGRAWQRTGVSDSLSTIKRTSRAIYGLDTADEYGGLPDELDHPEPQDDWSGGYGSYYQRPGQGNHYHLAYNFDPRFPRMLFHAQKCQMLAPITYSGALANADYFIDVPLRGVAAPPAGAGTVLAVGRGYVAAFTPNAKYQVVGGVGYATAFDMSIEASGGGTLGFGHRPAVFGSFTYIPNTNGSGFYRRGHDGTSYTLSDVMPARLFEVAQGRLWRGYTASGAVFSMQSCAIGADPMVTANWSATLNIGNGQMVSQDAIDLAERVFVGMPNGLFMGDQTGTFSNVATNLPDSVNVDNVRDLTTHNGMVVFAEGAHVWGYTPPAPGGQSVLRQLWPNVDLRQFAALGASSALGSAPASMQGNVTALTSFGRWLYAGVFTGTYSFLFCGHDASGPALPYVWHPMQWISSVFGPESVKVSRLHVDAVTSTSGGNIIPRRMWVATDASFGAQAGCTAPIYFWPIPTDDGPPMQDLTFTPNYTTQAYMEHSVKDWGSPGTYKVARKLQVLTDVFGSSGSVLVNAIADGTMLMPLVKNGRFIVPTQDFDYFTNVNNTAVLQRSQLTFYSFIGTDPISPLYRAFVERGSERPRSNDTITAKVRIADHVPDRQGNEMRDGQTMLMELRTMSVSANPFVLTDLVGATLPVVVLPPVEEEEVYQGGSDMPEIVATIKLGVLDASWPTAYANPLHPHG